MTEYFCCMVIIHSIIYNSRIKMWKFKMVSWAELLIISINNNLNINKIFGNNNIYRQ